MNFLALLDRSPYDFMLTMSSLDKEIMTRKKVNGVSLSAYEFYFGDTTGKGFTDAQIKEREEYRMVVDRLWGKDNAKHVSRVMETWHQLYNYYERSQMNWVIDPATGNPVLDGSGNHTYGKLDEKKIKQIQDRVHFMMSTAAGNVKMRKTSQMEAEDIGTSAEAQRLAQIMLGGDGLQGYFRGLNEDFADHAGHEHHIGDKKFFHSLAIVWFEIEQRKIIPSTNEMVLEPYFQEIAVDGEDVLARTWSDPKTYHDIATGFVTIDQMMKDEAAGNPKPMDEFMQKITALAANEGAEGMARLNYIVGYIRLKFLQEHHNARDIHPMLPGPGRIPGLNKIPILNKWKNIHFPSLLVGNPFITRKELAYSTLYHDKNAVTKSSEELRNMIHDWAHKRWIPLEGKYSAHWLEESLRIDKGTYLTHEVIPSMVSLMTLLFIIMQLRQAYEEEFGQGQQKKAH